MRRFVPPVLTTAATAGIVYWSLVTVTAASPDFSYAGSASGLRIWEKRCAATVSPRSEVCPDADRVYGEAIRI